MPKTAPRSLRPKVLSLAYLRAGPRIRRVLNEAIDQTAALYLKLREEETERTPRNRRSAPSPCSGSRGLHRLHNCYGVDLNETAVELAEVSIWLNVMHQGLQAPWFGLHLVRGNSLIGAGRRLYPAHALTKGEWLKTAPVDSHRSRPGRSHPVTFTHFPASGSGLGRGRGGGRRKRKS